MILYLFLSHLGLGIVFTLACVSREAGVKFFRFNAGLAAILLSRFDVFLLDPMLDLGGTRGVHAAMMANRRTGRNTVQAY